MKRITNLIGVKYIAFLKKKNHTKEGKVREIIKDVTDLRVMYICGFDFDSFPFSAGFHGTRDNCLLFLFCFLLFYRKTFDLVKNTYKRLQIIIFKMNAFNRDIYSFSIN